MPPEVEPRSARRDLKSMVLGWLSVLRSPATVWNTLSLGVLVAALSAILLWAQKQTFVALGQIAGDSRIVRVTFERPDEAATQAERQAARLKAPRVYVGDQGVLDEIRASLENLPRTLADVAEVTDIDPAIRAQFEISSPELLVALRAQAVDGKPSADWRGRVDRLVAILERTPLVDEQTFQRQSQAVADRVELLLGDKKTFQARREDVINIESPTIDARLRSMVDASGFTGPPGQAVFARLKHWVKPTFKPDQAATDRAAQLAADSIKPKTTRFVPGQVILAAGDRISADKLGVLMAEAKEYRRNYDPFALGAASLSVIGVALLATLGMGAYAATYAAWLWRAPVRTAALAGMVAIALLLACWIGAADPRLCNLAITAPTLLVTVILAVAYDRRTALAIGSLLGILSCVALDQPPVSMGVSLCAVWMAVWRLREFRQRNALIRAGLMTGAAVGLASLLLAGLRRPMIYPDGFDQALWEGASAAVGAILVGFIALGLLPTIERVFDVTTGMSLIELRDPRHPLLRMMQQRAPGTYNHSLTVAGLAEAAAEAIGADGLLAYVGALYHDIGKSTKPEYFIENQTGGPSRHDRLPPAISHLVIVGHVHEGLELAREHDLPKSLHHFIESHHGTTLVEYFFQRARRQAEAGGAALTHAPQETEYRYPGPKPRTREAAILMICDAAESATRTLQDPSPARIDSLVRAISHKRLMDGQFEASDLTMRDLSAIVEAVSRGLAAIHHQRIQYPEAPQPAPATGAAAVPQTAPKTAPIESLPPATAAAPGTAAQTVRVGSFPQEART